MSLALIQALPGVVSEARWLRHGTLPGQVPCLSGKSGYNKRLIRLGEYTNWLMAALGKLKDICCDDVGVRCNDH